MADEIFESEIFTLTDEDGKELQFELIGSCELDGVEYFALAPYEEKDSEEVEYVILKKEKDEATGEDILVTIDDDDEFDKIADIFEDELFNEVDFDVNEN